MEKKKKSKKMKAGAFIAVFFILLYVPSLINWLKNDNVVSDLLRVGNLEQSVNADGLIIRKESLLPAASNDGLCIPEIKEGERVAAFGQAASVSSVVSVELMEELDRLNKLIVQTQNEKMKQLNFFSEDIEKINNNIGLKVKNVIIASNSGTPAAIRTLKSDIDGMIEKKAEIAGESSSDSYINSLKKERKSIENQIEANTSRIVSEKPGIVSYDIDGYEQTLTPESIDGLTPKKVTGFLEEDVIETPHNDQIKAGTTFAKIIPSNISYITVVMDKKDANLFETGDNIDVRINDLSTEVRGNIAYKSDEKGGEYVVIAKVDRCAENLSNKRIVNVDFVRRSYEGLKVPIKCLFDINEEQKSAKIMLIKANIVVERVVKILGKNDEYAVIRTPDDEVRNTINLYDTYIINYQSVKEGQIIEK